MPNFHLAASNANLLTNYNQNNVISQTSLRSSYSRILMANLGYQTNKNSNQLPKDTRGIIPKDIMDIMIFILE